MNQLLDLALADSGFDIVLTDPTVLDSYIQYIGNLYETILFVILFVGVKTYW